MAILENSLIRAEIMEKGAELQSLQHKENGLEYMWKGDPAFWPKHSPVLFPIVGGLKNNSYNYNGHTYQLSRHGFARDMIFDITNQSADQVTFSLSSNADTKEKFPFDFNFSIRYRLTENQLAVEYIVANTGEGLMYFSLGGHPAFKIPLTADTTYTDYQLRFNQQERTGRWPLSPEGLIMEQPTPLLHDQQILPLDKSLFYTDAIVLKNLRSTTVRLESDKTIHGLTFDFTGFPYLGLWAARDADFICIEPWCGIADSVNTSQQLESKEGIEKLSGGDSFERSWKITLF